MVKFQISPECKTSDGNSTLYLYMDSAGNVSVQTSPLCTWTLFDTGGGCDLLVCNETNLAVEIVSFDGNIGILQGVPYGKTFPAQLLWKAVPLDNGYFCFQSQDNTGFNLNIQGNSYGNNTPVIAYGKWHEAPNEKWTLTAQ